MDTTGGGVLTWEDIMIDWVPQHAQGIEVKWPSASFIFVVDHKDSKINSFPATDGFSSLYVFYCYMRLHIWTSESNTDEEEAETSDCVCKQMHV